MQSGMMRRIAALLAWKQSVGFLCRPTGMTVPEAALSPRDHTIARLDEQGTSRERVGAYPRWWLGEAQALIICAAISTVASGGCAGVVGNEPITKKEILSEIIVGGSGKKDVEKILGKPFYILEMAGGEEQYFYERGRSVLIVRFTREGIVKEKGYKGSRPQ